MHVDVGQQRERGGRALLCRECQLSGGWGGEEKKGKKGIPDFRLKRAGKKRQQLKEMLCYYYCMEITAARRNPGRAVAECNLKKTDSLGAGMSTAPGSQ